MFLSTLRKYQLGVFLLTFYSYASLHACRQSFANAKSDMQSHWKFSKKFEGALDFVFLFSYAIGLYFSGLGGDSYNASKLQSIGLFLTGIVIAIFAASIPVFGIPKITISHYYFGVLWSINGLVQSTGWPTGVKLMANWFGKTHSGFIFGLWSANASFGNILGAGFSEVVTKSGLSVSWMLYIPAMNILCIAILIYVFVPESPDRVGVGIERDPIHEDVNALIESQSENADHSNIDGMAGMLSDSTLRSHLYLKPEEEKEKEEEGGGGEEEEGEGEEEGISKPFILNSNNKNVAANATANGSQDKNEPITFFEALHIPYVITYAACYACLKSVNYAMFFWLPFYLHNALHEHKGLADDFSMVYNGGQIFGGWLCGWISDIINSRSPPVFIFLVLGALPTFLLRLHDASKLHIGAMSCMAGLLIGGPANLISSAICADLGKSEYITKHFKGRDAMSTVAGIIDGTASFGAAIMQIIVSQLPWKIVFVILPCMLCLSALLILPLFLRDSRKVIRDYRTRQIRRNFNELDR